MAPTEGRVAKPERRWDIRQPDLFYGLFRQSLNKQFFLGRRGQGAV